MFVGRQLSSCKGLKRQGTVKQFLKFSSGDIVGYSQLICYINL